MPPPKVLIQLSGPPGAGKSTLALSLVEPLNAISLDHDIIRSSLLSSLPFGTAAQASYALQWHLAESFLQQGRSVIVDSACNFPSLIEAGQDLAARHGVTYCFVHCATQSIEVLEARMKRRERLSSQRAGVEQGPDGTENAGDGRESFRRWIEEPCLPSEGLVVVLDAEASVEEKRDVVVERVLGCSAG
ncbi:hypothetical protein ANO11243_032640 [Dothideomycetidae sp. 11243]|nr:hypothetical protein ANO11243_032640 [fungal sp. No.11243]